MTRQDLLLKMNHVSKSLYDSVKKITEMSADAMKTTIDRSLMEFLNKELLPTGKFDEVQKDPSKIPHKKSTIFKISNPKK